MLAHVLTNVATAATYYIDFDAGDDTAAGTATGTAWKTFPGVRKADNTGYVSTAFGGSTFTYNANKVPAGTIFKLKRGTTLDSTKGGWIQIDSLWYDNGTLGNPITIQADTAWGSGSVIIDGTGMTMPSFRGLLQIDTINYMVIDGAAASGIKIRNTSWNGIRVFDTGTNGLVLRYLEVSNGPVALVSVFSSDGATPLYVSDVTLDNIIAHDTTGTDDTSSCIYGSWLNNFVIKNCTTYNSGAGADGIHVESSHYGWIMNCTAHNQGEQGIDLSRNGSYKTRDDAYNITVRECVSYDNAVNDFDHNSGTHHVVWLNCFGWKTTSGQLGDPTFNVHQGSAGPNWWINCSSSKSMEGGYQFSWDSNPWSIPADTYPQYYLNIISSGDSTLPSARWGSLLTDSDTTGCIATATIVKSILNTAGNTQGTVNYKGTIYSASNVATGSGGFSAIGTGCLTNLPAWLAPGATTWALNNETPGPGSPALNGGAWPFKTSSSGSTATTLTVTNAYGLDVEWIFRAGDWIQIETGVAAVVVSVSSPGTIEIDRSATWSAAKGVWFNYGGSAPLIGAGFPVTAPTLLGFSAQPSNAAAGYVIAPAVQVTAYLGGVRATTYAGDITVALGANPGGGTLSGTLTRTAAGGIATFNDLSINNAGAGYTLAASASGLTGSTSAAFNITALPTPYLQFTAQPVDTQEATVITPSVKVTAYTGAGAVDTSFSGDVDMAIATNPSAGTLSGTTTQPAVSGVATFNDLQIDNAGVGYTLTATASGRTGVDSSAFEITAGAPPAPADYLAFTVQPGPATTGAVLSPAIEVTAYNGVDGTVNTAFTGDVTVSIGVNPGSGLLVGTKTVAAVSGVATFSTLYLTTAGNGYRLSAAAGGFTAGTSASFNVTGVIGPPLVSGRKKMLF